MKTIGDGTNVGLHEAYNRCYKEAKGDWIYLPHSDMLPLPGWDLALLNAAKGNVPSTILLCSRSVEPTKGHTNHHKILNFGTSAENINIPAILDWYNKDYKNSKESRRVEVAARMPFFLHRSLLDKMSDFNQKNNICDGPFDNHYFSFCQDDDIIQTCWHLGVRKFHMVFGSLVYHIGSQSNKHQTVDRDSDKPYQYFIEKWRKWYPDIEHPAKYHPRLIPFGLTVR